MTAAPVVANIFGFDDYLAWEAEQPERFEYRAGEVFAMAGGKEINAVVALNLAVALHAALRGSPCRVHSSDMKLRIEAADAVYYPDVFVTCQTFDPQALFKTDATVIFEVLSASTASFDATGKFADYRLLPSLQEYGLVDPERRTVQLHRHHAENRWSIFDYARDERMELVSIECQIALGDVFAGLSAG